MQHSAGDTSGTTSPRGECHQKKDRPYGWLIFSQVASVVLFYIVLEGVELSWWEGETEYSRSSEAVATVYPFLFIPGVIASWILLFRRPEIARKISSLLLAGAAFAWGFTLLHIISS